MAHVFISYKREDRDFAFLVRNEIEKAGYGVWIDDRLEAGESWIRRIEDALSSAFALVLVLTPQAQSSQYVTYEWSFALGIGIPVFPILRTSVKATAMHQRLNDIQQLDFRHKYDWVSLLSAIERAEKGYEQQRTKPDDVRVAEQEPEDIELHGLLTRLKSPNAEIRLGAVRALGLTQNPAGGRPLAAIMLDDEDQRIRIAAAQSLGAIGDTSNLSSLATVLLGSSDSDLRMAAVLAIEAIGEPETIPALKEALRDELLEVQRIAIRALSNFDDTEAITLLAELVYSSSPEIKWQAAYGLLDHVKSTNVWLWYYMLGNTTSVKGNSLTLGSIAELALKRFETEQAQKILDEWEISHAKDK